MNTIKTLNNSKLELEVAKQRLEILLNRKQDYYRRYGGNTAVSMCNFEMCCERVDYNTGLTLNEEIVQQYNLVDKLSKIIFIMERTISQLKGIDYELYSEIVINGKNISKAVEKVAGHNYMDVGTIWKNYYPRIKYYIKDLKRIQSSDYPVK